MGEVKLSIREILAANGETPCRSCPHDYPFPATHIAHPKLIDGTTGDDWPVCSAHVSWAMVAGWFPIDPIPQPPESRTEEGERC